LRNRPDIGVTLGELGSQSTARSARIESPLSAVMRRLDPRIHLLAIGMHCRVKPGNDNRFNMTGIARC
jgi:hypothetical protein